MCLSGRIRLDGRNQTDKDWDVIQMTTHRRSQPERTTYVDKRSGRTIEQLTNSPMSDVHTYYDISPWSPDGRHMVFSAALPADITSTHRDTMATANGQVYLMDLDTFELRLLADNAFYNTHTGAFPVWHPTENKVFFYSAPEEVSVVDAEWARLGDSGGEILGAMQGGIRQISPDGKLLSWTTNDIRTDLPRGVYTLRADGGSGEPDGSGLTLIASTEALYDMTPNNHLFHIDQMTVGNTKWTPDAQHMLVAMWIKATPDDLSPWKSRFRRSIYIVSRDGSERRWLTFFGHHHSWTAGGAKALYSGYRKHTDEGQQDEPRLYTINFDGSGKEVLIDRPLGGHPIASPDGSKITTWDEKGVVLVDLKEQSVAHLAALEPAFDQTHRGTHPHCLWSLDGQSIVYNSAQSGRSLLYRVSL